MSTLYKAHRQRWNLCCRCQLAKVRTRVVLARGTIPAPILFCGEAPGSSEDVLGQPFVGPAGKLLDKIIEDAEVMLPYALTNLVACIPLAEEAAGNRTAKTDEPPREAIEACADRLLEFIDLCQPGLLISVGKLAEQWTAKLVSVDYPLATAAIVHPAAILRMKPVQRGLAIRRASVTIANAVEGIK